MVDVRVREGVYVPAEDTFLIAKHIPTKLKGKKVLDLGCGSGLLAVTAAIHGGEVTATDINPIALKNTGENAKRFDVNVKLIESDLFNKIGGKFDLILFNPPYIPSDEHDIYLSPTMRKALVSGKRGIDIMKRFLKEYKNYLKRGGKVLLVVSSLNKIKRDLEKGGWKEIDSDSFFYEKIYLMEFKY